MSTNVKAVLSTFSAGLSAMEADKAAAHKNHLALEAAATDAISTEAAAALNAVTSASKLGMSALVSESALIGVAYGTDVVSKSDAAMEVAEVDGILAELEAARVALDKARATLDTALDAERTRALAIRAQLAGIAGDNNGAKK